MPGIGLLDGITSYNACNFLSFFITAYVGIVFEIGAVIIPIISSPKRKESSEDSAKTTSRSMEDIREEAIAKAYGRKYPPDKKKSKGAGLATIAIILGTIGAFCILYGIDGRYSKTDIGEHGETEYTYFGQAKNGVRYGFGKLFDNDHNIVMVANARGNRNYENVTHYTTSHGCTYIDFKGNYTSGNADGYGEKYKLIEGDADTVGVEAEQAKEGLVRVPVYEGYYVNGQYTGQGTSFEYDSNGKLAYSYEGCWAQNSKCGYGVEKQYRDGTLSTTYRGTFWNDAYQGIGIYEYGNGENNSVRWLYYGRFTEGKVNGDGAFYDANGEIYQSEENGTLVIDEETGEESIDHERLKSLEEKWPIQDRLIAIEQ